LPQDVGDGRIDFPITFKTARVNAMTNPIGLRWLPAILLVLILYPAFVRQANAQVDTTYNIGDIVEFQYNNQTGISGPKVWMKGKIATKCIGDTCGVLKWNDYTNDWMDGWISIYLSNIRRPGGRLSAPTQQVPPQASANAQVAAAAIYEKQADSLVAVQPAAPATAATAAPAATLPQPQQPVQQAQQAVANPQSCPTQVPPGTVTRSSPPSAQTFQRAIFDMVSYNERGQVGLVFTKFDMQPTRKNIIIMNRGLAEKLYPNVPEGAIVYPIKTTYVYCVQDASLSVRTAWKTDYTCMKDKFNDWSCPADSTPERLEYKVTQK
jgi:hypothetical protein